MGEDVVFLFRVLCRLRARGHSAPALYFYRLRQGSAMHTLRPELLDLRVSIHEEAERLTVQTWPELAEVAKARTLFMRLYILNDMMDHPGHRRRGLLPPPSRRPAQRDGRAFEKPRPHVACRPAQGLRVLLCLCPALARSLHRRRVEKREGKRKWK